MSELINNSKRRKEILKKLILKLHRGESPEQVRKELMDILKQIPYGEVVEVEQQLISEGLPEQEVIKLCDVHGEVLHGNVDLSSARQVPEGHPVDIFNNENWELLKVISKTRDLMGRTIEISEREFQEHLLMLQGYFNELMDVDKHFQRKEYLVFPYLEKNGITGPPKVMWGKHDEIRDQLKGCRELLGTADLKIKDLEESLDLLFYPALRLLEDMVKKEEEILFPMCMDVLTTDDWWNIHQQTLEFGFTLYDPRIEWKPEGYETSESKTSADTAHGYIQLPSGNLTPEELMHIFNIIPVDMTWIDRDDKVRYFTQGKERIFARSRSILNRDVRLCHPPGSVHIVEKILDDFKSGKASRAPFWIQMKGRFIHIEYFAIRDDQGEYMGTLEVSQDLTEYKKLEGEQRILSYVDKN